MGEHAERCTPQRRTSTHSSGLTRNVDGPLQSPAVCQLTSAVQLARRRDHAGNDSHVRIVMNLSADREQLGGETGSVASTRQEPVKIPQPVRSQKIPQHVCHLLGAAWPHQAMAPVHVIKRNVSSSRGSVTSEPREQFPRLPHQTSSFPFQRQLRRSIQLVSRFDFSVLRLLVATTMGSGCPAPHRDASPFAAVLYVRSSASIPKPPWWSKNRHRWCSKLYL